MNIFKILANGDGSINEANISAFLGYLLNPYQDHGLGFEFLERFLGRFFDEREEYFNCKGFDYEILFEQAFRDEDQEIQKREIVDIVILCFESNKGNYKELIAESKINSKRELKYIFLLENKITSSAKKPEQIKAQFKNTIKKLKIDKSKVISFYITPDDAKYHKEFIEFKENDLKFHYFWKRQDLDYKDDIFNMLLEIIKDESAGKIEAMNEYTKHTLISFVKFIENNFKSQFIEKKENTEGKYKKDLHENIDTYFEKYYSNLYDLSNSLLNEFENFLLTEYKSLNVRHSKTHPISVFINKSKIFSCSKNGKKLKYHILNRNYKNLNFSENIKKYLNENNYKIKEENWGIELNQNLNISELKELFKVIINIIDNSKI